MKIKIPKYAENIINRLNLNGFAAYVVGGCVRDSLMGVTPKDWDVCTSALPEQVIEVFSDMKTVPTGLKHGTVTVFDGSVPVEITTFRSEGTYSDGRHPDSVSFVDKVEADLSRRDFTVNAMAYSPEEGLKDPFGGRTDLEEGRLRCVGEADLRFEEDALRIVRALRFMSTKGFFADADTESAIRRNYYRLENVSWERIDSEFMQFMCGAAAAKLLDEYREVFAFLIPELEATFDFDQRSPYHNRDVWHHILCGVEDIKPEVDFRIAMLLHDIAKPVVFILDDNGRGRFVGHPKKGAEMTVEILTRMKFSNERIDHISRLVKYHDAKIKPERTDVRKWIYKIGEETFRELMDIRHADASGKYPQYLGEAEEKNRRLTEIMEEIIRDGDCTDMAHLEIDGNDLKALGFRGQQIGQMLDILINQVMEDKVENEKGALCRAAEQQITEDI